jgi:hypothetical protein
VKKSIKFVRAMLRDALVPIVKRLSIAPEGEDVQQGNVIEAPEVRELLAKLAQAREQHYAIGADKLKAGLEADRVASEIGQIRSQLDAKEKALAISGGLPEDAFPEEAQIARLERQQRVVLARVSATQEHVVASRNAINDLMKQLDSAWLQLGVEACQEISIRFREAALALRKVQCEHMAWLWLFSNKPGIPGWWHAQVIFPAGGRAWDDHLVDHNLLTSEEYWRPLAGELADAIRALYEEVEAAKRKAGGNNG